MIHEKLFKNIYSKVWAKKLKKQCSEGLKTNETIVVGVSNLSLSVRRYIRCGRTDSIGAVRSENWANMSVVLELERVRDLISLREHWLWKSTRHGEGGILAHMERKRKSENLIYSMVLSDYHIDIPWYLWYTVCSFKKYVA